MKKLVPEVTLRVIAKAKENMDADKAATDKKFKDWNRRLIRAHPSRRMTPPPEVKEEDKDPKKADSD